jgi:outer membrane protein OmpA-like peptidoglycan-associated protein
MGPGSLGQVFVGRAGHNSASAGPIGNADVTPLSTAAGLVIVSCGFVAVASCLRVNDPDVEPAVAFLASAVQQHRLVAIGEHHGSTETKNLLAALLRHPNVAGIVNDIVVEFGNARYQELMDAYVAGETVSLSALRGAWENTSQVTGVWLSPIYAAIFGDVRSLNATLPPAKRFRVLLGDPPIDWTRITSPADEDMNDWRDAHFAWVVDKQVIRRNRRAILFIGGAHLSRRVVFPNSLIHLLDRRYPGQTLVADVIEPEKMEAALGSRVLRWPAWSAAPVRGSWLGRAEAARTGFNFSTGTIEENIDVALYLSPRLLSSAGPEIDWNSPYGAELQRRQALAALPFRTGRVRFKPGEVAIDADSEGALAMISAKLRRDGNLRVTVKAFADGTEPDGARLSHRRADALVSRLVSDGIARDRLSALGCGDSRPLWYDDTDAHRAANRRAEFVRTSGRSICVPPTSFD